MSAKVFTVSQINHYVKRLIEDDILLNGFFVEAEISNFKSHYSGHLYFTLKDEKSAINCVMFKGYADTLLFRPEEGMKVMVYGKISIYEKTGQTQLYAEIMEPFGKGSLYTAFEQLKKKLEKASFFEQQYKKPIPELPKCVAVVTSPTGAAVRDVITVLKRRNAGIEIVVVPVQVQGNGAAAEIAQAIRLVNEWGGADVMICGRGGGSIEDLWAFNEEIVARAVFDSRIPVISAVGHETDFTICDFVADLRAPTPSAAAELATADLNEMKNYFDFTIQTLNKVMYHHINTHRQALEHIHLRLSPKKQLEKIALKRERLLQKRDKLNRAIGFAVGNLRMQLDGKIEVLEKISPFSVLKRGYALVTDEEGNIVATASTIRKGQQINIRLSDGSRNAVIKD